MKKMLKISITLMLLHICMLGYSTNDTISGAEQVPQNAIVLAQSGTVDQILQITLVDLDNNELVIVYYSTINPTTMKVKVFRTGITIDMNRQSNVLVEPKTSD